jgi:hypothetical protein
MHEVCSFNTVQKTWFGYEIDTPQMEAGYISTKSVQSFIDPLSKQKLRGLSPQANYTDRGTQLVGEVSTNFCG